MGEGEGWWRGKALRYIVSHRALISGIRRGTLLCPLLRKEEEKNPDLLERHGSLTGENLLLPNCFPKPDF